MADLALRVLRIDPEDVERHLAVDGDGLNPIDDGRARPLQHRILAPSLLPGALRVQLEFARRFMRTPSLRSSLVIPAIVLGLVAATAVVAARQETLPDGRTLLARHVEAIGGAAAFAKITSIHARGRFQIPAQGITGDLEIFSARPARLAWRATVPGIGAIATGYDGHTAWSLDPIS